MKILWQDVFRCDHFFSALHDLSSRCRSTIKSNLFFVNLVKTTEYAIFEVDISKVKKDNLNGFRQVNRGSVRQLSKNLRWN